MAEKVATIFFANSRAAVEEMRRAGMQDAAIASILCDIRAAAIFEERLRLETVLRNAPPHHPTWVQMRDAFNELFEPVHS